MKKILALSFALIVPACLWALTPPDPGTAFVYPSPVNAGSCANIVYNMRGSGTAKILIYGESGDLVDSVVETKPAGVQQSQFCTYLFASGAYFYRVILTYDSDGQDRLSVGRFYVVH